MNLFLIIVLIILVVSVLVLMFFVLKNKLNGYKEKMDKAETIIDEALEKKQKLIISLNTSIKKVTGKKDYLKDYTSTNELIISNIERDLKLDEAVKLINELASDYSELNKDSEFTKNYKSLRENDEVLIAAKNLFNQNAILANGLIKNFPYNIVAKISKQKIRSYYNKTDDGEF